MFENQKNLDAEMKYVELLGMIDADSKTRQVLRLLDVLNDKAATLLAHVSIMIAVLIALFFSSVYTSNDEMLFKIFLLFEIVAYLIIAMFCLRVNWATQAEGSLTISINDFYCLLVEEQKFRRRIYKVMVVLTWVVTSSFILTLLMRFDYFS